MKDIIKQILIVVMALAPLSLTAQNRLVKGLVLDQGNEPMVGAVVLVQGTTNGVVTDVNGVFEINASAKDKLVVSFLGYMDEVVSASSTNLKIIMKSDAIALEETVVVGYGVQKKATLTGAVSAVTNKDMTVTKNENVVNMLSGKIAGVRITQNSSQPGEFDNNIDIRGMGTPLIVVDGVPRDKSYFSRMDANEIESVSVLKDASAAIYGVRAANGVILVTTKHGSSGTGSKFNVDFSANVGWQQFLYVPETAEAAVHMMLMNEKQFNVFNQNYPLRSTGKYSWDQILEYSSHQKESTNWADELFKENTPQQQYNLSLNGSSDKIDYFFNLGYMDQMGSYKSGSLNYNRWNFRSNVDARITKRFKASVQLSGYMDEKNQPYTDIWSVYKKAWTYRPTSQAWIDGDYSLPGYDSEMLEAENPVASTDSDISGYRRYKNYNINGAMTLTYETPVKGLNLKGFYSYDYSTTDNSQYKRTYYLYDKAADGTLNSYIRNSPGSIRRSTSPSYGTVLQLSANYDRKFADTHHVKAMFMYEEQYNKWDDFYAYRETYLDNEYLFAGEEENQIGSMSSVGDISRRAFIGHLYYDYKGKYILDASFRADASSRFPAANRWGYFPSVSAGWRISEEGFIKDNLTWINNLKIRASWGRMGDDASAGTYPPTVVGYNLASTTYGWFYSEGSLMTGVVPTSVPNEKLTWYTADTYNAGIDFSLWNDKLGGTFEVFKRKRNGLLATSSVVLPGTVGATMPQENIESDMTFGYEVQLSHRNRVGNVSYWVSAQMSATKNRWDYHLDSAAGNSMENWYRKNVSGRNKDIWFSVEEGGRFSNYEQIQNHGTTGLNYGQGTLPGDYWYVDWNEDGIVDDNDKHPVATYNLPVFNYGLTLGAEWKGIDISMNFQGAAGVYNQYNEVFTEVGPFNGGAALDIYEDRWHTVNSWDDPWNPNTEWIEGYYPATGHSFSLGTTGIKNTSYLRLKTLEIGYSFPSAWLKKFNVKGLRIYFNGYNLLTFSGLKNMDPERPGTAGGVNTSTSSVLYYNYPVNRTLNIGANFKF